MPERRHPSTGGGRPHPTTYGGQPSFPGPSPTPIFGQNVNTDNQAPRAPETPFTIRHLVDAVPRHDYARFVSYIVQYQHLMIGANEQVLIIDAVAALCDGHRGHAANCVEKSILLRECRSHKHSRDELTRYLKGLQQMSERTEDTLADECKILMAYCEARAREAPASNNTARNPNLAARNTRHDSVDVATTGARDSPMGGDVGSASPPQSQNFYLSSHRGRGKGSDRGQSHRRGSTTSTTPNMGSRHGEVQPETSGVPIEKANIDRYRQIEENQSFLERTGLIGDFKSRTGREAARFFTFGRVFAIFLHMEDTDETTYNDLTSIKKLRSYSKDLKMNIVSRKSRFVVVREGTAYCWALPISTYGGRGVRKFQGNPEEIRAHAMIYTGQTPQPLENEPLMPKAPIRVSAAHESNSECRLDGASRVNFSRVQALEHNLKAVEIGKVHPNSLPYFESYWNEEKDRDARRQKKPRA